MRIDKRVEGDVTVIAFDGALDSGTAGAAQQELEQLVPAHGAVLLDLSRMSYMSSAGLRVLLLVYRWAKNSGTRVTLADVLPDVREVMAATGFLDFFEVADSVADGVAALT